MLCELKLVKKGGIVRSLLLCVALIFASPSYARSIKCELISNVEKTWLADQTEMVHVIRSGSSYTDLHWIPNKGNQNLTCTIFESSDGTFSFQVQDGSNGRNITLYNGQLVPNEGHSDVLQGYIYRQDLDESVSWICRFKNSDFLVTIQAAASRQTLNVQSSGTAFAPNSVRTEIYDAQYKGRPKWLLHAKMP